MILLMSFFIASATNSFSAGRLLMYPLGERKKCRFTARVAPWETLSGAQEREITHAFTRRLARTKTASDWSIYSRDFTSVHLVVAILWLAFHHHP